MEVETITKETIKVEGMSCGHCEMRVKKAVEAVEGVQKAEVNLQKKQVVIEYEEGKENLEKVKAAIREAGYEPV
ncbi:MAG: copper ion binding protein [Methanosarcina sp.]|jgi:copper chaperone